jgi:hypothetical protein
MRQRLYHGTDSTCGVLIEAYELKAGAWLTPSKQRAENAARRRAAEADCKMGVIFAVVVDPDDIRWHGEAQARSTCRLPARMVERVAADTRTDRPGEPGDNRSYSMRLRD